MSALAVLILFQNCNSFETNKMSLSSLNEETGQPSPTGTLKYVGSVTINDELNSSGLANFVTFGQIFLPGDAPKDNAVFCKWNDQFIAAQIDKKTSRNGFLSHAIVTLDLSALPDYKNKKIDFYVEDKAANITPPSVSVQNTLPTQFDIVVEIKTGNQVTYSEPIKTVIENALTTNSFKIWLSGPLVTEISLTKNITNYLSYNLDLRVYANGQYKADFTFTNDWGYKAGVKELAYTPQIYHNGVATLDIQSINQKNNTTEFKHRIFSNWRHTLYSKNWRDGVYPIQNLNHLASAGAIFKYNTDVKVLDTSIAKLVSDAQKFVPMGTGPLETVMGRTGWRDDIGPETNWTAIYLLRQEWKSYQAILNIGNISGSIPWHYRDQSTGEPFTLTQHPTLWLDERCKRECAPSDIPPDDSYFQQDTTVWKVDSSHQPSLSYIPYLITGDQYYLRELKAQAAFNLFRIWPYARQNGKGILIGSDGIQLRGGAWDLRTGAHAAFITPDNDRLKPFFNASLNNTLNYLLTEYVNNPQANLNNNYGYFKSIDYPRVAPWQEDFVIMVLGVIHARQHVEAKSILNWKANFALGRFLQSDDILCKTKAPGYWWEMQNSWISLSQLNNLGKPCPTDFIVESYPDTSIGYVAGAMASAATLQAAGAPNAEQVLLYLKNKAPNVAAKYGEAPVFAISP